MSSIINVSVTPNYNIRVCRVCLVANSENAIEMESEDGFLALYEFCVGISLTSKDVPLVLCTTCADTVKTYAKFKQKCHQSETFWKSVSVTSKMAYRETLKIERNKQTEENNFNNKSNVPITDDDYNIESPSPHDTSDNFDTNVELSDNDYHIDSVKDAAQINIKEFKDNNIIKVGNENNLEIEIEHDPDDSKKLSEEKPVEQCKYCQKPYKVKGCLIKHLKSCSFKSMKRIVHSGKSDVCGLCKFSSTHDNDMTLHLNEHWSGNILECKLCDFVGVDMAHYIVHRYFHCPEVNQRRFSCHICNITRPSVLSLHYHYRAIHLEETGGLCWYCMKQYDTMRKWRKHIVRHENALMANYICDHCGGKFIYRSVIEDHMERYHLGTRKVVCELCGKVFKRNSHLSAHKKHVHEKSKPVKCLHCNKMFKSPIVLRQHQRRQKELKLFACAVCPKKFGTQTDLNNHKIWHSDERPYKCTTCGTGYKAKSHLKIHIRSHTGERPYKCQHCDRSFSSINPMKIHSSTHTGVRAHKCKYCERSFHERKQLHVHVAKCHEIDVENENK